MPSWPETVRCGAIAEVRDGRESFQCVLRRGHPGTHYWRSRPRNGRVRSCSWIGDRAIVGPGERS